MKKFINVFLFLLVCCLLAACNFSMGNIGASTNSGSVQSVDSSSSEASGETEHQHDTQKILEKPATCTKTGTIECYYCWKCKTYFLDENAEEEISYEETRIDKIPHTCEKVDEVEATCGKAGVKEHWVCSVCSKMFLDETGKKDVISSQLSIPSLAHKNIVHQEGFPVFGDKNGEKEHWYCEDCNGYFLTEDAKEAVPMEEVILYSAINIPDFIVEIPEGRDPIILQLTDTQIMDGSQARPDKSEGDKITYAPSKIKGYCYDYLTEIITETKPDFIIITGDLVYGCYDDNGSVFKAFVEFMDSFEISWAPVFGNHENESKMGVDWQCEQLENAKYCKFEQKELTGNGNYSVGILQGGEIKRVFYMMDTGGCSDMSAESMLNGHTTKSVGFGEDQIKWYTEQITELKKLSPETKISFAYHIQQSVFGEAYAKYGFDQSQKEQNYYIDYLDNCEEGDFGYLGRQMKTSWDSSKTVYEGMKKLGVDSVFVGHEHCNSASVVYEGIRFQYGQKSSEYDRYNLITAEGEIKAGAIWSKESTDTPLVGGSVIVLSETDGSISDAYIYYCKNAGGNVDWDAIYANK